MLIVLAQLGLRRGELADLRVEDWDRTRGRMRVKGKGGKARFVPVPVEAAEELAWWVGRRRSGPMWPSTHRAGKGLAPGTISRLVAEAGQRVGVDLWTHLLRHKALTDAAERGARPVALARAAGHEDPSTTMRVYIHPADTEVAAALEGRSYWRRGA